MKAVVNLLNPDNNTIVEELHIDLPALPCIGGDLCFSVKEKAAIIFTINCVEIWPKNKLGGSAEVAIEATAGRQSYDNVMEDLGYPGQDEFDEMLHKEYDRRPKNGGKKL